MPRPPPPRSPTPGLEPGHIDGLTYSGAFADFDVAAFHEHFGTTHEMWSSHWGGGMSWAGTAPYLAAKAIGAGKARHVLNVFPVAWATQRSSMTGGPGEVHATQSAKQNLEVPFGWFPQPVYFATIMRRHMLEFGTTEEQFGAVAVACRRHANLNPARRDAREEDDDRRLPRVAVPRRAAPAVRLVPHLRRRRCVRDDERRARQGPPAHARGGTRRRRGTVRERHPLEPAARTSRARPRSSPRHPRSRWPG